MSLWFIKRTPRVCNAHFCTDMSESEHLSQVSYGENGFYPVLAVDCLIFVSNFIYVLGLTVCKKLSKISYDVSLFCFKFSRIFKKHAFIVLPSNSVDDCSSWCFDGLWKSEGVFRLIFVNFSAMFLLLILSVLI